MKSRLWARRACLPQEEQVPVFLDSHIHLFSQQTFLEHLLHTRSSAGLHRHGSDQAALVPALTEAAQETRHYTVHIFKNR